MSLEFLGKDPDSDDGQSPTVWVDREADVYVIRGWQIADAETRAVVGDDPPGELTMRFPRRMMRFFEEVNGDGQGTHVP
ncbi:hypothetical protein SMC26_39850 [Actinomadura fulvescens]|uniref:DUF397 domain-containing protein n=1 Tax=Actinomadura fulvescens TaxID=46160 RepID=A0ABP6DBN5_9ACTN